MREHERVGSPAWLHMFEEERSHDRAVGWTGLAGYSSPDGDSQLCLLSPLPPPPPLLFGTGPPTPTTKEI